MAQPTLLSMHNVFLLEHNRIARGIEDELGDRLAQSMNPLEVDEIIFQVPISLVLLTCFIFSCFLSCLVYRIL